MAIYLAITKVFESNDKYIYEISDGRINVYCIAVIIPSMKTIEFYKDFSLKDLLYSYTIVKEHEKDTNTLFPHQEKNALLWGRSLSKLIPALEQGVFPDHLDKRS